MNCIETRVRKDGIRRRTYALDDGRKLTTFEIPATILRTVGIKKIQSYMEIWKRGEAARIQTRARRQRIETLLREKVKPLAIADEVGVSEQRVHQIRKEISRDKFKGESE